jgi:uncharacterized protein YggE
MRTWIAALFTFLLASTPVSGQQPTPTEPVVMVTGEGLVKAPPDQAFVTLAAENRSRNPKDAQAQNAKAMTAVQQALTTAGIPKDAVRTLGAQLTMESDWVNGRQVPRGYVARNTIEVRLDDIARVGEVMDLAVTSGATTVHGVRFDVKQREMLEREALKRATADARARAEAAAAGAGRTVDRVVRIEEPSVRPMPRPEPLMMMREAVAAGAAPETPVVAGDIEIRATILLTATLK